MIGKINPVILEVVNAVAFQVIDNDLSVTFASEAGQLQLNAMEPIMAHSILQSIRMMLLVSYEIEIFGFIIPIPDWLKGTVLACDGEYFRNCSRRRSIDPDGSVGIFGKSGIHSPSDYVDDHPAAVR